MKQYWDIEKLETAIQESGGDIPLRLVVGPNRIGKTNKPFLFIFMNLYLIVDI